MEKSGERGPRVATPNTLDYLIVNNYFRYHSSTWAFDKVLER